MLFAKCAPGDIINVARCRVISSGQSYQLSAGTVKKPTSPVGFFTSGVIRQFFLQLLHIWKPLSCS
ncbi:hypothetical protein E2375_20640 [Salmonella enterica subsp. enterica serovar Muenchen]|nr:hypothetical protein [Salmonella enterica subsp. enterica serovar Muenchen]EGV6906946.1 hypothetical protein [Salmonella enterica]